MLSVTSIRLLYKIKSILRFWMFLLLFSNSKLTHLSCVATQSKQRQQNSRSNSSEQKNSGDFVKTVNTLAKKYSILQHAVKVFQLMKL